MSPGNLLSTLVGGAWVQGYPPGFIGRCNWDVF